MLDVGFFITECDKVDHGSKDTRFIQVRPGGKDQRNQNLQRVQDVVEKRNIDENQVKELLRDMKTSWIYQTKEFFESSTLHGVRYIAEENRPFFEKFMWFCFTSIGAVATLIIIVSLWEKFQTNPTITGLDTDFHNWDVPFPAITICQENPFDETKLQNMINRKWPALRDDEERYEKIQVFFKKLVGMTYENMIDILAESLDDADLKEVDDFRTLIFEIAKNPKQVIRDCDIKGHMDANCTLFVATLTELGICYSMNSLHAEDDMLQNNPGMRQEFDFKDILHIYETDSKWSVSFRTYGEYDLAHGIYLYSFDGLLGLDMYPIITWYHNYEILYFSVKETYTTSDASQLSISQRRCVFENEMTDFSKTEKYTFSACMRQCRIARCLEFCSCIPHFYPKTGNQRYCALDELTCIARSASLITTVQGCNCQLGCHNRVYELEKLGEPTFNASTDRSEQQLLRQNLSLELQFLTWPMVRYKREVLFGWVDLLVSFGGIAGLFLGFSLLSGVEIIYYFTMRAFCMVHINRDELRQFKQELELAKNRNYDLSYRANWPWFDEKYDAHKDFKTKSKVSCLAYIISAYE
ncbi:sodium channel protein Nach [Ctenocephalides felis]|uniref:sodium channel protein Nach n=1 Tax=Ctenocephalides felis TaxID=7515 RepID=UPI000E6E225A|nr:sodium channel protein Nach [Ctenocephalides felis]